MTAARARALRWCAAAVAGGLMACSFGIDLDQLVPTGGGVQDAALDAAAAPDTSTPPPPLPEIAQIGAGNSFTCVRRGGAVTCWGASNDGRLGDGRLTTRSTPAPVVGFTDAIDLAVGA